MGWLMDLAKPQGLTSYAKLAQAMKESRGWPKDDTRNVNTVANKLGHADRGEDLEWWTGTGKAFLDSLAFALDIDENDLLEHLESEASKRTGAPPAKWVFKMFPALAPLDLREEQPFPGVPKELLRIGGPKAPRTWWIAPAGAGKTLVGRWLEMNHGWTYRRVDRLTDLELLAHSRTFVELTSPVEYLPLSLTTLPGEAKLCIACASSPPERSEQSWPASRVPLEWPIEIVSTPPPQTWMNALIDWIAARIKPGGGFDADALKRELRNLYLSSLFETPGDLLEFAGLVEEIGVKKLLGESSTKDPLRWARAWLAAVSKRLEQPELEKQLAAHGADLLLHMELARHRRGLDRALTRSAWIDLVPRELPTQRKEPVPAAPIVIESFEKIGALVEGGSERMLLRPAWAANGIANLAFQQLYDAAPEGLGVLLLFKETSEITLRRLLDEVHEEGFNRVRACAANDGGPSPERLAALDGAFRVVGLALADDVPLPIELARAVWTEQMRFVAPRSLNQPPTPIVSVALQDHWQGLTPTSVWFLAAFAIARALTDAGDDLGSMTWNLWRGLPDDEPARQRCLEALAHAGSAFRADHDSAERDPRRLAAYRLGGDLLRRVGLLQRHSVLTLQGPDLVVDLATGMAHPLEESERSHLLRLPFGLEALKDACVRRKAQLADVLAWCWRTWGADTQSWPPTKVLRDRTSPSGARFVSRDAAELWRTAPAAALSEHLLNSLVHWPAVWPLLTEEVWARWLEVWAADGRHRPSETEPFRHVPIPLAIEALRDGSIDKWATEIRRILWVRMPQQILALIDELAASDPTTHSAFQRGRMQLSGLVFAAPNDICPALIERAGRWLESPSSYPGVGEWLRPWLTWTIEQRSPGWRDACALALRFHAEPSR